MKDIKILNSFLDIDTIYLTDLEVNNDRYINIGKELDGEEDFNNKCFQVLTVIEKGSVECMWLTYITNEGNRVEIEILDDRNDLRKRVFTDILSRGLME